jgi:phytoene dehydrogenase-like protein
MPDVIVVGAGHNGLVAACDQARAGRAGQVGEGADHNRGGPPTPPNPRAPGD